MSEPIEYEVVWSGSNWRESQSPTRPTLPIAAAPKPQAPRSAGSLVMGPRRARDGRTRSLVLAHCLDFVSAQDVANRTGLTRPTVRAWFQLLHAKGLVERELRKSRGRYGHTHLFRLRRATQTEAA